jgi:hypothetical protein
MSVKVESRRKNAKSVLEKQLTKGTKPEKVNGKTVSKMIPLTEGDKKRITNEIDTLSRAKKKK